jgi:hypothetical protein
MKKLLFSIILLVISFGAKAQYPLPSTTVFGNLTVQDTVTFSGGYMPFSSNNLNFGYGDIPFIGAGGAYGDGVFVDGIGDWSALSFPTHMWAAGYLSNGGLSFVQVDTAAVRIRSNSSVAEEIGFQTSLELFSDTSISGAQSLFSLSSRAQGYGLGYVDIVAQVDTKLRLNLSAFNQFDQQISLLSLDTEYVNITAPEVKIQSDLTVEKYNGQIANFAVRGNGYNRLAYSGYDEEGYMNLEVVVKDTSVTDYGGSTLTLNVSEGFRVTSTDDYTLRSTIDVSKNFASIYNSSGDTIMISNADGMIISPVSTPPNVGDILTAVSTRGVVEWQTPAYSSGIYTPTATDITNIASSTTRQSNWSRVGNIVTVAGAVTITTNANGLTQLAISLPIASDFGNIYDASGNVIATATTTHSGIVYSNVANDYVVIEFRHNGTVGADDFRFTYSYEVL